MWMHRGPEHSSSAIYLFRRSRFIDRDFQIRYTGILAGAAGLGVILAVLPLYYFLNQNYQIFVDLAYDHAPLLLGDLERERVWIHSVLFGTFAGLIAFFTFLGIRMTNQMVGPLKVLKNHLKQLSRGNWKQREIAVREKDEFQDLIDSYNYFYKSFQASMKRELELLNKISVNEKDRDSYRAWSELVRTRISQLNEHDLRNIKFLKPSNDESGAPSHEPRHAS